MKVLIVDGTNLLFRGFFASARLGMHDGKGNQTGAFYLSIGMLNRIKDFIDFSEEEGDKIIFAFDNRTSKVLRKEKFDGYKAGRDHSKSQPIFWQIDKFKEMLGHSEIDVFDEYGLEADDICGILIREMEKRMDEGDDIEHVYVYSSDKDFYQFLSPMTTIVKVYQKELILFDYLEFDEEYELTVEQFVELKAIVGDGSDNIIGFNKLGEKGVLKILNEYGDAKSWFDDIEGWHFMPKWAREEIEEGMEKDPDKKWCDIEISWYEDEDENGKGIEYKKSTKDIFYLNLSLVQINFEMDGLPKEETDKTQKKIDNLFKDTRDEDGVRKSLEEMNIKKVSI